MFRSILCAIDGSVHSDRALALARDLASLYGARLTLVHGDPARGILDAANAREVDAIVMGSRGLGKVKELLLGSVSRRVSQEARCTCITVR